MAWRTNGKLVIFLTVALVAVSAGFLSYAYNTTFTPGPMELTNTTDEICRDTAREAGDLACGDYRNCDEITQNAYDQCIRDRNDTPVEAPCDDVECGNKFAYPPDPRILEEAPVLGCPDGLSCP